MWKCWKILKIYIPLWIIWFKIKKSFYSEKYYLADLSIYYALKIDDIINYGHVIGNTLYFVLKKQKL